MRKLTLALFAAGSALASTAASAQDAPTNPVFTGPRVAILGGYDAIRPGSSEDSDIDGDNQTVDGFLYGAELGYDFAAGGALIGIEGEISDSTGKVQANSTDPNFFGFGRVATDRDLYIGARAGILATPRTLVYVKGGYTNARLDVTASDGTVRSDANFKLDGYRVGAGVEQAFGGGTGLLANGFFKLEYRYSNYNDAKFNYARGGSSGSFDIDTDRHQVVAGVGIRF
jgi:outer membrane immunogenic protein